MDGLDAGTDVDELDILIGVHEVDELEWMGGCSTGVDVGIGGHHRGLQRRYHGDAEPKGRVNQRCLLANKSVSLFQEGGGTCQRLNTLPTIPACQQEKKKTRISQQFFFKDSFSDLPPPPVQTSSVA